MAAVCVLGILGLPGGAPASSAPISVFPSPGSRLASTLAQIAFRGVPASQLGSIRVTGSRSGSHPGTVRSDSDGLGGSFFPRQPFSEGETVTVRTGLNVVGGRNGTFRFSIADFAGFPPPLHWPSVTRNRGDVWRFSSRPDITPAALTVSSHGPTAPGDLFLGSQYGPVQDGPEIVDGSGNLIWFKRMKGNDSAADVRVQSLHGQPVLTWWQGYGSAGAGFGEAVINNTAYKVTQVVHAANGLRVDLHEFEITPQNTALITAYYPVWWDVSSVGGSKHAIVFDSVVQEIDLATGLLLFQWDSLDHVPLRDSYVPAPTTGARFPFDYFHVNSVQPDRDGTLIISARNTSAVYKIDHSSGRIIWTLGGKRSSFKVGPGASFFLQHDARFRSAHDWYLTLFDDGGGPPRQHASRGLKLFLDHQHMIATVVAQHGHSPSLDSNFEGSYQQLSGGDDFLGWGQAAYFTEFNSRGQTVLDGHYIDETAVYRAYRYQWTGAPRTKPAVATSTRGGTTTVFVSWNGATNVASWRVLGGGSPRSLRALATARKTRFESTITVPAQSDVAVQALDGGGHVLSQSETVRG